MGRVLAVSSMVSRGHVGLSAIVPALNALGHEVIALPTVLLSSHKGHRHVAGLPFPAATVGAFMEAFKASGWLAGVDAVLTGYLPSASHVASACEAVRLVRMTRPDAIVLCDPVIGDQPGGLYVDPEAARALRAELLPLADIVTPNSFELAWLAGATVSDPREAIFAARSLPTGKCLVTSLEETEQRLGNLLVTPDRAWTSSVDGLAGVPHGTGDLLSALLLGAVLNGLTITEATARAVAGVDAVVRASLGRDELVLVPSLTTLRHAVPAPLVAVADQDLGRQ